MIQCSLMSLAVSASTLRAPFLMSSQHLGRLYLLYLLAHNYIKSPCHAEASWVPDIDSLTEECARKDRHHAQQSRLEFAGGRSSIDVAMGPSLYSCQIHGKITDRIEDVGEGIQFHPNDCRPTSQHTASDCETS